MKIERIVVGVDGSAGSRAALEWARDEAVQWDAEVIAVQAWEFTPLVVATDAPIDLGELKKATVEGLDAVVREVFGPEADRVEQRVVEDLPAQGVLDASAEADLIVVGSRGLGGVKSLLLGSVGQKIVHHAEVPVVIVRPHDDATEPGDD